VAGLRQSGRGLVLWFRPAIPYKPNNSTAVRLGEEVSDFHAVPEIAAAVHSFVISREAVPGICVYFAS
jgi:hypothetical protein